MTSADENLPLLVEKWTVRKVNKLTGWYDGPPMYSMIFETWLAARAGIVMVFGYEGREIYEPYPVLFVPVHGKLVRYA